MVTVRPTGESYKYLVEHANDAMWILDINGNTVYVNGTFKRLVGLNRSKILGNNITDFLSQGSQKVARGILGCLLNGEEAVQPYELQLVDRNGQTGIVLVKTNIIIIDGKPAGFYNIGRDLSEEGDNKIELSMIIDGSPIPSFVIDKLHTVTHWNTALESISSISKEKMVGTKNQWQAFYAETRPTMADLIVEGATDNQIEEHYHGKQKRSYLIDGAYEASDFFPALGDTGKWLHFTASPIKNNDGEIVGAVETLQDVTEARRLRENMQFYTQLTTRAQEEERKRIARDLHDDVSLPLLVCTQSLDAILSDRQTHLSSKIKKELEGLQNQTVKALDYLRWYAQNLRPGILDHLGLIAAIEWMAEDMENKYEIKTQIEIKGNRYNIPDETQLLLFRIAQEALTNIRRHAEASQAVLTFKFHEDSIVMTITDNGKGFNVPKGLGDLASGGRLGIMGMSERARLLGGTLDIKSVLNKGTQVIARIPLSIRA